MVGNMRPNQYNNPKEDVMHCLKMIAFIFLAIFLILTGAASLFDATPGPMVKLVMNLLAIFSGIFLLVSVGRCHCKSCQLKEKEDK
jgi:hypothetical protein